MPPLVRGYYFQEEKIMNRTYYRLSTIVDKNRGQGPQLETEINELDDENLPPMHVIIDACYIIIQTFYRRFSKAIEAEEEARNKWQAGQFNDFLDELISELAKYKSTDNQMEVKS
jgi:hypothetical protein